MSKVLVVENPGKKLDYLSKSLESKGLQVLIATDPIEAISIAELEKPDLIVMSIKSDTLTKEQTVKINGIAPTVFISASNLQKHINNIKGEFIMKNVHMPVRQRELMREVMLLSLSNFSDLSDVNDSIPDTQNVLIVDDIEPNIELLDKILFGLGYNVYKADSGKAALEIIKDSCIDLILLDIMMPEMDGFEVCEILKLDPKTADIPIIFVTACDLIDDKIKAFEVGGYDYITKPFYHSEVRARVSSALRLKKAQDSLKLKNTLLMEQNRKLENTENIIVSLIKAVEAKNLSTQGHSQRVARIALEIASFLQLSDLELQLLRQGAMLHDIGKIGIPDSILNKPGSLTEFEYAQIKTHPSMGDEILKPLYNMEAVRHIVRNHHERLDGSGYPDGLKGDEIDILTRIVSVADVYDALSNDRPYRKKLTVDKIRDIFREEVAKGWWDPDIVSALFDLLERKPTL